MAPSPGAGRVNRFEALLLEALFLPQPLSIQGTCLQGREGFGDKSAGPRQGWRHGGHTPGGAVPILEGTHRRDTPGGPLTPGTPSGFTQVSQAVPEDGNLVGEGGVG